MLAFSKDLHTNLGVAIGRREGFGAAIGREAISDQDVGFLVLQPARKGVLKE